MRRPDLRPMRLWRRNGWPSAGRTCLLGPGSNGTPRNNLSDADQQLGIDYGRVSIEFATVQL